MNEFELFQTYDVTSWQANGLTKLLARTAPPPRHQRRKANYLVQMVTSTVIALSVATCELAIAAPAQAALAWPAPPTVASTKQSLSEAIRNIRKLGDNWNGHNAVAPMQQSIAAAERMVQELPDVVAQASAGVNGEGNVYFRFAKNGKTVYLTIEPNLLHLICMEPRKDSLYIDDEQFRGKKLPAAIRRTLTTTLA